ncbi:hypothetical protein CERSUDRAFT_172155 [Gelatoporia subvermispora B]|uniref:Uncharacterized protein n=1 Tax=Ceriporiopsis subvermispora (strain B) TaxID=914234 RepID=M2R9U0_CERS8|nr:hypothetical protein CERSUDRAFT_172155 [Gelatoporia subvermispora B]
MLVRASPPVWRRGNPTIYVDYVTIPHAPADKVCQYRVIKSGTDLGVRPTQPLNEDGSQTVKLRQCPALRNQNSSFVQKVWDPFNRDSS